MKKLLIVTLVTFCLAASAFASTPPPYKAGEAVYIMGQDGYLIETTNHQLKVIQDGGIPVGGECHKVSSTDVGVSKLFKDTSKYLALYNADTVNEVWVTVTGTTAVSAGTGAFEIPAGYTINLTIGTDAVSYVSDNDEDGYLYIYVTYQN